MYQRNELDGFFMLISQDITSEILALMGASEIVSVLN